MIDYAVACRCPVCWCLAPASEADDSICPECSAGEHKGIEPVAAANPAAPPPRKCARHRWVKVIEGDVTTTSCERCGTVRDEVRARRGKSARRLGGDQERRIERVYGPAKIGERGDPVDHLGTMFKYQSKASRRPAPPLFSGAIGRMDGLYGDRIPVLVLSFVKAGVPVDDYIVIRGRDWLSVHGRDEPGDER